MAIVALDNFLKSTADAIRTKNGETTTINPQDFSNKIKAIWDDGPQLYAPTITLSGTTLRITNPSTNGNFVQSYKLYVNSNYVLSTTATSIDLLYVIDSKEPPYRISVRARAPLFKDSADSNSVVYTMPQLGTPTNVTTANVSDVSWDVVDNAKSYKVYVDNSLFTTVTPTTTGTAAIISVRGTLGGAIKIYDGDYTVAVLRQTITAAGDYQADITSGKILIEDSSGSIKSYTTEGPCGDFYDEYGGSIAGAVRGDCLINLNVA